MERLVWAKPEMKEVAFAANEYVAACWKINCNVPYGYGYIDSNTNNTWDEDVDTLLTPMGWMGPSNNVHGCGEWHIGVQGVPDDGPVANAMWSPAYGGDDYAVYYWRDGDGAYDVHFSKVEDAEWETNPNAS